ncbi:MAG: site-2 protease family protein [Lachnospiraceae bacterium]|nr:site-2 protease family protein [Lachnospiraceae bacterium]
MNTFVTIIIFLIIFTIIVVSHEGGHFLVGRKCGIRVKEFTVGAGPVLVSKKYGDTLFSVRAMPLGGACIFDGESQMYDDDDPEAEEADPGDEHLFLNAPVWKRIATVFAGPLANFVLAFVTSVIIVAFSGVDLPVAQKVVEGSAAEEAGMMAGDEIRYMNGERTYIYREVSLESALNEDGQPVDIVYRRNGTDTAVTIIPKYSEEDKRYYIGIVGGSSNLKCNALQVFQYGAVEVDYWFRYTLKSLRMLFTGKVGVDALSGPVGVADFIGDAYEDVKPYGMPSVLLTMLEIMTLLAVNLGIVNLLPLPAIDGGKLVLLFIEVIRGGKRIPPEKEGLINLAGVVVLMVLMVVVLYNDIMRLFK